MVVLRDGHGATGIEVLMVRRNTELEFAGGMWVFPGGRVDESDRAGLTHGDTEGAARRAAVREAREEADIVLDPHSLVWFSHWTPPPISPKRFGTWFFAAPVPAGEIVVTVDGGEIHDHCWTRPGDALSRKNAREIDLAPPTWITLEELAKHTTVQLALDSFSSREPEHFGTQVVEVDGSLVAVYHGDVAYDGGDPSAPGGRHRLWMNPGAWRYERDCP